MPAAPDGTTRARDARAGARSRGEIALDRAADVGQQRVELGVGAGGVGELQALLELVDVEPAVAGRATERQTARSRSASEARRSGTRAVVGIGHDPEVKQPDE